MSFAPPLPVTLNICKTLVSVIVAVANFWFPGNDIVASFNSADIASVDFLNKK